MSSTCSGFALDLEADGFIFESTKIWSLCLEDLETQERLRINPFKDANAKSKFIEWLDRYESPVIAFHNGLGYDIFVLFFLLDLDFSVGPDMLCGREVSFVDTFYLSMFLNPDRQGHSIEDFGTILGYPKMDFRQACIDFGVIPSDAPRGQEFQQYTPIMDKYCEIDTSICKRTFQHLMGEWTDLYGSFNGWTQAFKSGQKSFYLMSCQELSGWKFDVPKARGLELRINEMMEEIRLRVEPQLPPRKLKKTEEKEYKMPAKPYKADGTFSAQWGKFVEKHNGRYVCDDIWEFYGKHVTIESDKILDVELPMQISNQDQMKDWFLEMGWEPTLFNYKRGADGKPLRDPNTRQLIPTSPKIQEAGKLCPNLEKMEGALIKDVVKWLSLRNRLAVLEGWLSNPRLDYDGRIGAGRTGIASTHRQKHKVVVNVPKADPKVLLGYEFRELWTSEDGFLIAAGDAAALEGRVQGHYTYRHDGGATAEELLAGDVHCFSEDTEILTERGWMRFNEIGESKVAQYDGGEISFTTPSEVVWKKYKGPMVWFKSNSIDKLVTPNHRVLLTSYCNPSSTQVVHAADVSNVNADIRVYSAGESQGVNLDSNLIEMICAVQSDAHITPDRQVRFEFMKSRKIDALSRALDALNLKYSISTGKKGTTRFYIPRDQIEFIFKYVTPGHDLTSEILNLGSASGRALIECYGRWDGTFVKNGDMVLDTKSSVTTDMLQALASKSGLRTSVTKGMVRKTTFGECIMNRIYVSLKSKPWVRIYKTKSLVEYDGMVGCVTVPSGFIVVRRSGKTCISGNSKNTNAFYGGIYREVAEFYASPEFDKESPKWKPYRSKAKNGFYAILYGAAAPKVASTLGIPEKYGKEALEAFWNANPGTKKLKENLESYWELTGKKKCLPAIDGRLLLTRKKSALLNTIFQSCGGIAMDYAGCFMDKWLGGLLWDDLRRPYYLYKGRIVRRIGYFHDELEYECESEVADDVASLIEKAIAKAGEYLKIKVPLAGEGKVGKTWKEVH